MATQAAPPETRPERWAMFSPLRYRNYRYFSLGQFPCVIAMNMLALLPILVAAAVPRLRDLD